MDKTRILNHVLIDSNGCWVWQRSTNSAGYGQLSEFKKYWLAHRYSYICFNGDLKKTEVVRHMCHNPRCCNPEHLKKGTHMDNYHDSRDEHIKAATKRRGAWIVAGVAYSTVREASICTGITMSALCKHTKNGLFDIEQYRYNCYNAGKIPKV